MNWSSFPTLSLIYFIISPSAILSSLSLSYFIPFSARFFSHFPHLLLHHYGFPHASLPHLYLHQSLITSLVIHSPLSFSHHVFFFSFVWYSNITIYMIILLQNIHAYLGISVYFAMHICAYFIYISVLWYFSVHSFIKKNQHWVVFGSFRYLG